MTTTAKRATFLACAAALALLGSLAHAGFGQSDPQSSRSYPNYRHTPCIVLLHDDSATDLDWAHAAQRLRCRFDVLLVNISELPSDRQAVPRLRSLIEDHRFDQVRISGTAAGQALALRYALSYPQSSRSFTLPHSSEDLALLADLFNATPFSKS